MRLTVLTEVPDAVKLSGAAGGLLVEVTVPDWVITATPAVWLDMPPFGLLAANVYVYEVLGVRPVSLKVIAPAVVVAICVPFL